MTRAISIAPARAGRPPSARRPRSPESARPRETAASSTQTEDRLRRVERLANLMDGALRIPGTKIRFGLDSVIGLVPGLGDSATALVSAYIVLESWRLGLPLRGVWRMVGNILVDLVLGSLPIVGDIFDVFWKSNRRNTRIVREHLERQRLGR